MMEGESSRSPGFGLMTPFRKRKEAKEGWPGGMGNMGYKPLVQILARSYSTNPKCTFT